MSAILQDVRYALRQLRGAPVFTLTAVLTLALGIGATVTMYSIVRNVLLEPLPYSQPDRLVGLAMTWPQSRPNNEQAGLGADYVMQHSRSFESFGVIGESPSGSNLSVGAGAAGHALQIAVESVSKGYFTTLGVQPLLGRSFTAEEDLPGGPKVAILSYGVWTQLFNRDAGVLNRVVHINGESYTVVGVMPASMHDEWEGPATDVWQPLQLSPKDPGYEGDNYNMIARLKPGVSMSQAQQEMDSLKTPFYKDFPMYLNWTNSAKLLHEFRVWPLKDVMASNSRTSVLALAAAVFAVLLVACLNLAAGEGDCAADCAGREPKERIAAADDGELAAGSSRSGAWSGVGAGCDSGVDCCVSCASSADALWLEFMAAGGFLAGGGLCYNADLWTGSGAERLPAE
jgi:putative ABC transport system permease protein